MYMQQNVLGRMETYASKWEALGDDRSLFLRCYMKMSQNMYLAVESGEFRDSAWVKQLLERFAEYYFLGVRNFEDPSLRAPEVWLQAHTAALSRKISALQKILSGINAHINYDLVLAVADQLRKDWPQMTPERKADRYSDHLHVNQVISRTIDMVQEEVIEPEMPLMDIIDRILGPIDEFLISKLIKSWRETVWLNATFLIEAEALGQGVGHILNVQKRTLDIGNLICGDL